MIYVSEVGTPLGLLGVAECKERFLAVWPGGRSSARFRELGIEKLGSLEFVGGETAFGRRFSEFLAGGPRGRISIDLSLAESPITQTIYRTLFRTRAGDILTPSEVAERSGGGVMAEDVLVAVRSNPLLCVVPCYRVREGGAPVCSPENQPWARFFAGLASEANPPD